MSAEPEFVKATLDWCNERRKERGKKPLAKLPKGERGNGYSCPCGKATGLFVRFATFGADDSSDNEDVPESVAEFVWAFDRGALPQYEVGS